MSDYGVTAETWEPLPWSWAAERLTGNRNFWLVTVSGEGRPHALPVWGVWDDGDHRFVFSCAAGSTKAANLAENPRVVVMVDDTVECVSVEGRATRLTDEARLDTWVERYLHKYRPISPDLDGDFIRGGAVFEVTPDRVLSVIEREDEFATRPTRWTFGAS